jgi:hypothetical protein
MNIRARAPLLAFVPTLLATLGMALSTFAVPAAHALTCAPASLELFPTSGEIPPNTVFVLQGTGERAKDIGALALGSLELRTPDGNYPLKLIERSDGPPAILRFASVEPNLREGQLELWILRDQGGREPQWIHWGSWNVQGVPDETYPAILQQENHATVQARDTAWGESISAEFSVTADEARVYWLISADLSSDMSPMGQEVSFYADTKRLSLYTGPCGANYPLEHRKQYLVDLTPVDAAGHHGRPTAPSIVVEIP